MDPGIIDIGSDHELADNEYDSDFDYEAYNDRYDFADGGAFGGGVTLDDANDGGMIDLTGCSDVPDVDDPPAPVPNNNAAADAAIDDEHLSAAACLQMVLNILPDISVVHVLTLLDETAHTPAACERIIEQLLDGGAYPKENDEVANRKRKREREDTSDSDQGGVEVDMPTYNKDA
jgi:TRIAD3 protein (E3 ubiquitin-protein ligase RNF216)